MGWIIWFVIWAGLLAWWFVDGDTSFARIWIGVGVASIFGGVFHAEFAIITREELREFEYAKALWDRIRLSLHCRHCSLERDEHAGQDHDFTPLGQFDGF